MAAWATTAKKTTCALWMLQSISMCVKIDRAAALAGWGVPGRGGRNSLDTWARHNCPHCHKQREEEAGTSGWRWCKAKCTQNGATQATTAQACWQKPGLEHCEKGKSSTGTCTNAWSWEMLPSIMLVEPGAQRQGVNARCSFCLQN